MSAQVNQKVTITTVVLLKPENWSSWIFGYEDYATAKSVWAYRNPALATQPEEPTEPIHPGLPAGDSKDAELKMHGYKLSQWQYQHSKWIRQRDALDTMFSNMNSSIAAHYQALIKGKKTVWERLSTLSAHIAPSDPTRKREIQEAYDAIRNPRRARNQSIDNWIQEWLRVTDLMKSLDMPEMKDGQVQEAFLNSVMHVHTTWATQELVKLLALINDSSKVSSAPEVSTLIANFRQFYRIIGSTNQNGTFGATLGVASDNQGGPSSKNPSPSFTTPFQPLWLSLPSATTRLLLWSSSLVQGLPLPRSSQTPVRLEG